LEKARNKKEAKWNMYEFDEVLRRKREKRRRFTQTGNSIG